LENRREENEKATANISIKSLPSLTMELPDYSNYCLSDSGLLFLSGMTVPSESELERVLDHLKRKIVLINFFYINKFY